MTELRKIMGFFFQNILCPFFTSVAAELTANNAQESSNQEECKDDSNQIILKDVDGDVCIDLEHGKIDVMGKVCEIHYTD